MSWGKQKLSVVVTGFIGSLILISGAYFSGLGDVHAQNIDQFSRSYVTPFPSGERYRLYVFGDSLGDGIGEGLTTAFQDDGRIEIVKHIRSRAGFIPNKSFNWEKYLKGVLKGEDVHIAVIMAGVNERYSIWSKGERHRVGSKKWREVFAKRLDKFLKHLKKKRVATYWVGLPIMRSPNYNDDMQVLNEMFRERAFINGVKFIDTWNVFADQFGRYSPFGPDLSGKVRRLRADDGIHFTVRGYRKLAHFVEREIKRDLVSAQVERNIPLAGNEDEQKRLSRHANRASRTKKKAQSAKTGKQNTLKKRIAKMLGAGSGQPVRSNKSKEQIIKIGEIKIIRPTIPEAVIASAIARGGLGGSFRLSGETVASDIEGGLTALASISPANELSLKSPKQRVPLTQTPYYRVLIKGDILKPKIGRADDFSLRE